MIKRFARYYKPHLGLFSLDMICAVIVSVCNLYYPTLAKEIINDYSARDTLTPIIIASLVLLGIYVVKAVCNYVVGYIGHVVGVRMQADMRRDLFAKYEKLPFSYFDNHKTGDLLSRLTNDLQDVAELAHHGPENVFLSVLMLVGAFIILAGINLTLTLIMFAVIPIIILVTFLSRKKMVAAMRASRVQMAVINSTLENSVTGVRETKAFVAEAEEKCKFERGNRLFVSHRSDAMRQLGSFHAVMTLLQDMLYLLIIFIGGVFLLAVVVKALKLSAKSRGRSLMENYSVYQDIAGRTGGDITLGW